MRITGRKGIWVYGRKIMGQRYEKPEVVKVTEAQEGVYLASGARAGAGWNISVSDMSTNENGHIFKAECTSTQDFSAPGMTIVMDFNHPIVSAIVDQPGFSCSCSGTTLTVTSNSGIEGSSGYKTYAQVTVKATEASFTDSLVCTASSCV